MKKPARKASTKRSAKRPVDLTSKKGAGVKGGAADYDVKDKKKVEVLNPQRMPTPTPAPTPVPAPAPTPTPR